MQWYFGKTICGCQNPHSVLDYCGAFHTKLMNASRQQNMPPCFSVLQRTKNLTLASGCNNLKQMVDLIKSQRERIVFQLSSKLSLEEKGIKAYSVAQQKKEQAAESWIIWGYRDVTSSLCQAVKFFVIPTGKAANTNNEKNGNFRASPPLMGRRTYTFKGTNLSAPSLIQTFCKLYGGSTEISPKSRKHVRKFIITYISKE